MNLVLIGMSGVGKSTLGVLLAKALGMDYVDTDIVIQQHEGRLLQEIINNDGIEKFTEIEENAVCNLKLKNSVIATGGSVIYSEKAMDVLKQGGQIIYLHVPYEEIQKRLKCTAPHIVNTVRQHFVEYFAGNIQPELNIPELNGYGCCYRNLCKPL